MRIQIGQNGINSHHESWYYLEFCENEGRFYHVHVWDNINYTLTAQSQGEKRTPLEECKDKPFYSEAIRIIKEKIFM